MSGAIVRRPKQLARGMVDRVLELSDEARRLDEKTSPATKAALLSLLHTYQRLAAAGERLPSIHDSGLRVFSQFDEDGVILHLLGAGGLETRRFVDLGAGDGVYASNCANLALNLGFDGLLVEADATKAAHAHRFYDRHPDTRERPPAVVQAFLTRENIDELVHDAGFEGEIDVLSIDVDGNDYWLWEALTCVSPRLVVVEAHTELGLEDYVMPYEADFHWRQAPSETRLGASPAAFLRLAGELGYRLVGSNLYGFNMCFARNDVATETVPTIRIDELFRHGSYSRSARCSEPGDA